MALRLKHGVVELAEHDPEWEVIAAQKIKQIWSVFGSLAINIQHVGSTAIRGTKAKPIIDIAIGVGSFDVLTDELFQRLDVVDIYKSVHQPLTGTILGGVRKNSEFPMNLHIVEINSIQWKNHIDFRDYINRFQEKAIDYEKLKIEMAARNPNDRDAYSKGKAPFIHQMLSEATLWRCLHDITGYDKFIKTKPINKGQSNDKKYYIETIDGKRLHLRVTDIAEYDRKKSEYEMLERVYGLGVPTPQPVDFGLCDGGKCVYSLSGWLDGEDAETLIPRMNEAEQYSAGLKAGALLRKIHTLPAPDDAELWESRFQRKVQTRIDLYIKHNLESENGERIIKYLRDKQNILDNRPQTFWHGDFNVGNHMIMPDGEIAAFDYNYWNLDHGDPWWEFVIIPWGKEPPAHYFSGMIKGYFNNSPPSGFFDVLSYYYACDALSALCCTFSGMENGYTLEDGKQHMENVLRWFGNMSTPVPTWYLSGYEV
jgi:serine/threonine-protein kinase